MANYSLVVWCRLNELNPNGQPQTKTATFHCNSRTRDSHRIPAEQQSQLHAADPKNKLAYKNPA